MLNGPKQDKKQQQTFTGPITWNIEFNNILIYYVSLLPKNSMKMFFCKLKLKA